MEPGKKVTMYQCKLPKHSHVCNNVHRLGKPDGLLNQYLKIYLVFLPLLTLSGEKNDCSLGPTGPTETPSQSHK